MEIAFAPLKPAEFVIIRISQKSQRPQAEAGRTPTRTTPWPRALRIRPVTALQISGAAGRQGHRRIQKVSALGRSVAPNEVKEAGDAFGPRHMPGMLSFDDVTLEQGWSADATLEAWANEVLKLHSDPAGASNFKRTVFIDAFDLAGMPANLGAASPCRATSCTPRGS
jgi:hypothetical protein